MRHARRIATDIPRTSLLVWFGASMQNPDSATEIEVAGYQQQLKEANKLFDSSVTRGISESYIQYLMSTDIERRSILYECDKGRSVDGSPFALFSYLTTKRRFSKYQHYWVVNDAIEASELPPSLRAGNVHLVTYESDAYLKALASCKYLINDSSFVSYFTKRDKQVYVNTWHGEPTADDHLNHDSSIATKANIIRNLLSADYLISDSKRMTSMYLDSFQLRNIYAGRILEMGCPRESADACRAIAKTVFPRLPRPHRSTHDCQKERLLFFSGGIHNNGITHALTCLLQQIDYDKYDVTVFLTPGDASILAYAEGIPARARVLIKAGSLIETREEHALREALDDEQRARSGAEPPYPDIVFAREARRCFGLSSFDVAIDFNGYERVTAHLALAVRASRRCIWLHSDMMRDSQKVVNGTVKHKKNLNHIFSLYPRFDRIVSCSEAVSTINQDNLGSDDTNDKFVYARNCIDVRQIDARLQETPLLMGGEAYYIVSKNTLQKRTELVRLPDTNTTTFINVGRLSPEKNQEALIRAFARLHGERADTELIILGEGPLRESLSALVGELGLEQCVHLPGNVTNPLIFMKRADCFVFPSLYEGQGLSVIEARVAGLPIIVSRFGSVGSVSVEGGQLLIGFDEASIYEGMRTFLAGNVPVAPFSAMKYNQAAYAEFERVIG